LLYILLLRSVDHRHLHSFPTRRSSDLTSSQAHSSIEKAVKIAGLGRQNLRLIEVDERFAMRPDALAAQLRQDRDAGRIPCFVCADRKSTRLNSSHVAISYAVFCLKKKK